MLDTHARKYFDSSFNRLAKALLKLGLRANHVTFLALVVGLASAISVWQGLPILGLALLWISGLLDVVDGSMARLEGGNSPRGTFLDIVGDRVVEHSLFWALALRNPESFPAMMLLITAALMSMTVFLTSGILLDKSSKKSFYYQAGLMERTEGLIATSIMVLFQSQLVVLTYIYAALIGITILQRIYEIWKFTDSENA